MRCLNACLGVLPLLLGINLYAADLSLKYEFIPSRQSLYQTSVVKPARLIEPLKTAIINATANDTKRPLVETQVVVIPAKNYYPKTVNIIQSNIQADVLTTYVVQADNGGEGYQLLSKGILQEVQLKIAQNPLIGCAPLSLNCSRTATDSADLAIEREPLTARDDESTQQRQQITP